MWLHPVYIWDGVVLWWRAGNVTLMQQISAELKPFICLLHRANSQNKRLVLHDRYVRCGLPCVLFLLLLLIIRWHPVGPENIQQTCGQQLFLMCLAFMSWRRVDQVVHTLAFRWKYPQHRKCGINKWKQQLMVGTHSLGFLLALVLLEVLGALGFPSGQVFQLSHQRLGDLECPRSHKTGTQTDAADWEISCAICTFLHILYVLLLQCSFAMNTTAAFLLSVLRAGSSILVTTPNLNFTARQNPLCAQHLSSPWVILTNWSKKVRAKLCVSN